MFIEHAEPYPPPLVVEDEQTEFKFDELSDEAKEYAREQRRNINTDHDWWEAVYDDANTIADMLGITIATKPVRLHGGGTRHEPCIYFSGFWSQGDGACFEGGWSPDPDPISILNAVMDHAPQDTGLHEIALEFADLSERCALAPDTWVRVTQSGRGSHSGCTHFDLDIPVPDHIDEGNELQLMVWQALCNKAGLDFDTFEEDVTSAMRSFMNWIYDQLEDEHDYLTSDEAIDEYLVGLTFDEDGEEI